MMRTLTLWLAVLALASAAPASAQQGRRGVQRDTGRVTPERLRLEEQLRQRTGQVVRDRLQLSDSQFQQLTSVNRRYQDRRRELLQRERELRTALRRELIRGDSADQPRVNGLLDDLMRLQQDRLDLVREEQRDLSTFLTPVQRAKYAALEEQMRGRINEFRRRQMEQPPRRADTTRAGRGGTRR